MKLLLENKDSIALMDNQALNNEKPWGEIVFFSGEK